MKQKRNLSIITLKDNSSIHQDISSANLSNQSIVVVYKNKHPTRSAERVQFQSNYKPTSPIKINYNNEPCDLFKRALEPFKDIEVNYKKKSANPSPNFARSLKKGKTLPKFPYTASDFIGTNLNPFKNFHINENIQSEQELNKNTKEKKPRSWFESVIFLKQFQVKEKGINEILQLCYDLLKDFVWRLKKSGKENEGVLVDKIFRVVLEVFDQHLENLNGKIGELQGKLDLKVQECELIKTEWKKQVDLVENNLNKSENECRNLEEMLGKSFDKQDGFHSKSLRKERYDVTGWYINKLERIEPLLRKMNNKFKYLENILTSKNCKNVSKKRFERNLKIEERTVKNLEGDLFKI